MSDSLQTWMTEEGLSDKELALRLKRDRTRVLRWRRNKGRPDYEALAKLQEMSGGRITAKSFLRSA